MSAAERPLVWWGRTGWPDGGVGAAPLTAEAGQAILRRLLVSPGPPGWLAPLADWQALVAKRRPDEAIPLAMAAFDYDVPPDGFAGDAIAALGSDLQTRRALIALPLLHEQFLQSAVRLRSRVVRWWVDGRFLLRQPGGPVFEPQALDCDDGHGPRPLPASGVLTAAYGAGRSGVTLTLHGRLDGTAAVARCAIGIGPPVAPLPDQTLALRARLGSGAGRTTGTAWIFLAPGHRQLTNPLLMAEGFPGGYPCDYLHDLMSQCGTLDALHQAGHDLVLLGFDQGAGRIQDNAGVYIDALQQLQALTPSPIVAAGMSMGGLVARYALTWMEAQGLQHRCRVFFTFDTPHQGAYTSVAAQFFARSFAGVLGGSAALAGLLETVADQQFVKLWLGRDAGGAWHCGESPERTAFLRELAALGDWPRQPLKLGLACGRGDGARLLPPGAPLLHWHAPPWGQVCLNALGAADGRVGSASGLALPQPVPDCVVPADTAWEGVPGSSNPYIAIAGALARSVGLGSLDVPVPFTTSIPTVSALALEQPPDAPVPPPGAGRRTPFDHIACAASTLPHLGLDATLRDALLAALGPADSPAPEPGAPA